MVNRNQTAYLHKVFPEVSEAFEAVYPEDRRTFINTMHISEYILANKDRFPIMGSKPKRHISEMVNHYLKYELHYNNYTNTHRKNGGRIFVMAGTG